MRILRFFDQVRQQMLQQRAIKIPPRNRTKFHGIFLDLSRAYDRLDRGICLALMIQQ